MGNFVMTASVPKSVASFYRLVGTVQEERHLHTIGNVPPGMANLRMDIVMGDAYTRSTTQYVTFSSTPASHSF